MDESDKDTTGLLSRDNPDLVERFAVIGSGEAECKSCQYVYEPKMGDDNYPVAKGTRFENLPPDWRCPVCGAEKKMFESRSKVVAGFRQNQGTLSPCAVLCCASLSPRPPAKAAPDAASPAQAMASAATR